MLLLRLTHGPSNGSVILPLYAALPGEGPAHYPEKGPASFRSQSLKAHHRRKAQAAPLMLPERYRQSKHGASV